MILQSAHLTLVCKLCQAFRAETSKHFYLYGNNNRLVTIPLHHTSIGAPIAVASPLKIDVYSKSQTANEVFDLQLD
jgi:hypothetical protein